MNLSTAAVDGVRFILLLQNAKGAKDKEEQQQQWLYKSGGCFVGATLLSSGDRFQLPPEQNQFTFLIFLNSQVN